MSHSYNEGCVPWDEPIFIPGFFLTGTNPVYAQRKF